MSEEHWRFLRVLLAVACLCLSVSAASAEPEAVCVPWDPNNLGLPHISYSGATIRLKGIARGDANEFHWDFGDGGSTAWTAITNSYALEAAHTYTGVPGQQFLAVLHVRNASGEEDQDTYLVELRESSDLTLLAHLQVRVDMAIDEGLWWLHKTMVRATFPVDPPGYEQPYGYWNDSGGYPLPASCTALDSFQLHGSKPNNDPDNDPYVETVRRAINYVLYNTYAFSIVPQPHGDPDTNGNDIGLVANQSSSATDNRQTYIGGICMTALASSGAPNREAYVGRSGVVSRTYAAIVQDMADFFAYGQVDSGSGQGGWRYYANHSGSDMSTTQWPPLALIAAERSMGTVVPQFVRDELIRFLDYTQHTACDGNHGGFGYDRDINFPNCTKAGAGIISHEFLHTPLGSEKIESAIGFLYRHWNDTGSSWDYQRLLGNSYGMYGVMKAMRLPKEIQAYEVAPGMPHPGFLTICDYDCVSHQQTADCFDWFYAPAAAGREGLAAYIVRTQQADGSWDDVPGPNPVYNAFATGWRILILLEGVTLRQPEAVICDCDEQEYNLNQDIHLDGACSYHQDQNRSIVSWEWDLDCDGEYDDATGPQATIAGGFPSEGFYCVGLRVTDENPQGAQSSSTSCDVWVHPPPHCPHACAGGPYDGFIGVPVQLDASCSWDPDNPIVSYEWDLDNDGQYDDCSGVTCPFTWSAPFEGVIGVAVTDAAGPYDPCTDYDFTTVRVGCHPPVADADGPYLTCPGCAVTLDGSGSYDLDPGDSIAFAWDLDNDGEFDDGDTPMVPFTPSMTVGTVHDVCLKVVDLCPGDSNVHCTTVRVVPNRPPEAICQSVTRAADENCEALVSVAELDSGSFDPDGDPITFEVTPEGPYPLGATPVTLVVTDSHGAVGECQSTITVVDDAAPSMAITWPPDGSCHRMPVTVIDESSDFCDSSLARTYSPAGGPTYTAEGDYDIVLSVEDDAGNAETDDVNFTIDLTAPHVAILIPAHDETGMPPVSIPISIVLASDDDDSASGGVAYEVIKLSGCTIYDGRTYGDRDGMLSDEGIQLNKYKLCQFMARCRFNILYYPTIRVEATDVCGEHTGGAERIIRRRLLKREVCRR